MDWPWTRRGTSPALASALAQEMRERGDHLFLVGRGLDAARR